MRSCSVWGVNGLPEGKVCLGVLVVGEKFRDITELFNLSLVLERKEAGI